MSRYLSFPFCIDGRGRTAEADRNAHVRQLIEQVLFTTPGERINRPTFGTNLRSLLFSPLEDELSAVTEHMAQAALREHLSHWIQVQEVQVEVEETTLRVTVRYVALETGASTQQRFERGLNPAERPGQGTLGTN